MPRPKSIKTTRALKEINTPNQTRLAINSGSLGVKKRYRDTEESLSIPQSSANLGSAVDYVNLEL